MNKYRIQDYLKLGDEELDRIYKNRMDCEHANFLLKEHLGLKDFYLCNSSKNHWERKSPGKSRHNTHRKTNPSTTPTNSPEKPTNNNHKLIMQHPNYINE